MTKSKLTLTLSLLLGAILASPLGIAQAEFAATGKILRINKSVLNLSDVQFKLSPTVKVILKEETVVRDDIGQNTERQYTKGDLSDLKVGDRVGIKMIQLGKKSLVDAIHILSGPVANEGDPPLSN